jgi:hypothetical protein
MRAARAFAWTGAAALVVLASRSLAYALAPHATIVAGRLEAQLGGPRLVVLAVVAPAVALALASVTLWLAAVAVRERRVLELRPVVGVGPIRIARAGAGAVVLGITTSLAFATLESYIHWRAGLGWHGLHCLTGPVHRDAIPLLWSLSLVAASVLVALEHLVAWMRRTIASLLSRPAVRQGRPAAARRPDTVDPRPTLVPRATAARGPPTPGLATT